MDRTGTAPPAAGAGIDVSKDTLDACLLPAPGGKARDRTFANDPAGHAALAAWADEQSAGAAVGFGLGSTGAYGEALAASLGDAGRHVAVVNPARVMYAGLARGQGNKTDKADAKLIAEYAARERPGGRADPARHLPPHPSGPAVRGTGVGAAARRWYPGRHAAGISPGTTRSSPRTTAGAAVGPPLPDRPADG